MERFIEYWQAAMQQQVLHAVAPDQIIALCQTITRDECTQGSLQNTLQLQLQEQIMVVVPYVAVGLAGMTQLNKTSHFFPLLLLVQLDAQGKFIPIAHLGLPIIPRINLEPQLPRPISLGQAEQFTDYFAINPPIWQDEPQDLTWIQQLAYAQTMLDSAVPNWRADLAQANFQLQDEACMFPLSGLTQTICCTNLNYDLLNNPHKITVIDAELHADSDKYAKDLILNAWVQAALKQIDPPCYVYVQPNQPVQYASIFACLGASSFIHTNEDMHTKLVAEHEIYLYGQQVLRNWQEVSNRIREKYLDKGGVNARLAQLQNSAKEAKALRRHFEVLYSIWERQKELLIEWHKIFDFIPVMQRQRLQRLYAFFKQNFPQTNVLGCTQEQLDELLIEKLRRAENSERMINDALHQVENDLYQELLVKDRCLQWCLTQHVQSEDFATIKAHVQERLWQSICRIALIYWQQEFAAKQGYANFLIRQPDYIDFLIVANAEYIAPQQGIELLARSKSAAIMGNYNPICNPRFPVQIDYELTKHYGLIANEADFEDLQFDGVLGSVGNLWNIIAKDREADHIFTRNRTVDLQFELVDVRSHTTAQHGSCLNQGVADAVIDWLHKHAPDRADIVIYTCFGAQLQLLQNLLQTTLFARIPILSIQEPYFAKAAISIFVPVYSGSDPGPYIFDRGAEMLDQLLANTESMVVIIGDRRIFKPQLHSASGKFAKLFQKQPQMSAPQHSIISE